MRALELLSPAKNLECGIAAIDHGADAVYIGAERFGARVAAGNTLADIEALCAYAHRFHARVYVTVNTILYDHELEETEKLIRDLQEIGVDALLVQDMGIIQMRKQWQKEGRNFPILHASTQADNRTVEKVRWLRDIGFRRVVLARELSLDDIREIHDSVPDVELEAFVHGALCVSYSGVCYASQYCFGRSANRGACAQFCRMKFDLLDAEGKELVHQRHLLSLRDMCRIDDIKSLAEAGVTSFKIEGRLKDVTYVKNVVTAYSKKIDELIQEFPQKYCRASLGTKQYTFIPQLQKSFSRGFTNYFLYDRLSSKIPSFNTPKAIGEPVGRVKEIRKNAFVVAGTTVFNNGDGLCFFDSANNLNGFRINRVENNSLYPQRMPSELQVGMQLFRNYDAAFERQLQQQTAVRKVPVSMCWKHTEKGFSLMVRSTETNISVEVQLPCEHQLAQKPQGENIRRQLSRLGDTVFECVAVEMDSNADDYFVPSSILADVRRKTIKKLETILLGGDVSSTVSEHKNTEQAVDKHTLPHDSLYAIHPYMYNVSNHLARAFYAERGMAEVASAFELDAHVPSKLLMQCRHCLRYEFGACIKYNEKKHGHPMPKYLRLADGRRFRLEFDCKHCQMNIYAED